MKTNYYPQRQLEPISLATGTVIAAGLNAASQGFNAAMQGSMNRKTREWNEKMYQMQRQHSLQDWAMQNEYNSPAAQMQRLKMAGLNPNLVYGKGADNVAGVVRSTDVKGWNPQAPEINLGSIMSQFYDVQVRQAQLDNLKTQNTVLANEGILKATQAAALLTSNENTKFDLGMKQELKEINLEAAREGLRKLTTDIDLSLQRNEREILKNNMDMKTGEVNLRKSAEEILNYRKGRAKTDIEIKNINQAINNLQNSNELQKMEIELRKQGINPNDRVWERVLGQFLDKVLDINPLKTDKIRIIPKFYW